MLLPLAGCQGKVGGERWRTICAVESFAADKNVRLPQVGNVYIASLEKVRKSF
jgi:hypothetical protein